MGTVWRMSFRYGSQGKSMWPKCLEHGVAAISYGGIDKTDLAKYKPGEPKKKWKPLAPAQKASLRRVAYEMKKGDIIYAKEGTSIIGKGTLLGPYKYDTRDRVLDPHGDPWNHQVPVKWHDIPPVQFKRGEFGADQLTVIRLTREQVELLESRVSRATEGTREFEVQEGQLLKAETSFRKRNSAIIARKKALSDGTCEACEIRFADEYGIKEFCLVAHHKKPIGRRKRASKTTIDDIALVCPNCHAVAHKATPPYSIEEIKKMLKRRHRRS